MSRLQPQIDQDRNKLQQQLADQGIRYGSPAYDEAFRTFNDQVARNAWRCCNKARPNNSEPTLKLRGGGRQPKRRSNCAAADALAARNAARSQVRERYARRAQPIQEISALLSQGQVSLPQWYKLRVHNPND